MKKTGTEAPLSASDDASDKRDICPHFQLLSYVFLIRGLAHEPIRHAMPSDGQPTYGIALLHRRYSSVLDITDSMPECVVRQRRLYADVLLRDRMDKLDTVAQQADAAVWIGTRRTILQVALYGTVHIGQLAADLMMAARHEIDFQQCVTVRPVDYLVMQNGFLGRRHLVVVSIALVLPLVAHKPVGQCRLGFERRTRDNRPISLVYLAIAEHIVQPRERLGGLGKNDQPRYRPVESVDNSKEYVAGLLVLLLYPSPDGLGQRFITRLVALDNLAGFLVDDYNVVIFVKYLHSIVRKKEISPAPLRGRMPDGKGFPPDAVSPYPGEARENSDIENPPPVTGKGKRNYMFMPPSTWMTWPDT